MKLRAWYGADHYLILFFVILLLITNSNTFATDIPDSTYQRKLPSLLHRPPEVMFHDRPT